MVVPLFSAVRGAVVVLVPNLIPAVAGEGHGGERNDCPVLAHKLIAGGNDTGCIEYLQHLGHFGKRGSIRGFGDLFLALIDAVMGIRREPKTFRRQDNQPPADEVLDEPVGGGVYQWI
jgi:hypothetical protein